MSQQESYNELKFFSVDHNPLDSSLNRVTDAKLLRICLPPRLLIFGLSLLIAITWALPALSQEAQDGVLSKLVAPSKKKASEALPVDFMNRPIFTIRSEFMGYTQEERAMSVRDRIKSAMEKGGDDHVSIRTTPEGGRFIELNGLAVFQIRPGDLDPLTGESADEAAKNAAENLNIAVHEARERSNSHVILKGFGLFMALCEIEWVIKF